MKLIVKLLNCIICSIGGTDTAGNLSSRRLDGLSSIFHNFSFIIIMYTFWSDYNSFLTLTSC